MIGSRLGHFRITAKLGEGGMGEVYCAEDTKLGREVAVKVLPEAFAADPDRMARFEREARVLASLNHPRIAGIFEVGEADIAADEGSPLPRAQRPVSTMDPEAVARTTTVHYLVMELAPGETLEARIARGPLTVEEALNIGLQISEGLEAAHERGIVHRDLKPGNVMVDERAVKILDFGLAKALEGDSPGPGESVATQSPTLTANQTRMGVILGTAAYMSPEQARGVAVDRRADVWSFGCVVYEMLTGVRPFAEDTVTETLAAVLKSDVDLGRLPVATPPSIRRLLERCLDKDPRMRLRDIGEARVRIERYLADPEAQAGAGAAGGALAGRDERGASPVRRALPWGIAALALILAAAAWLAGRGSGPEAPTVRTEVRLSGAEIWEPVGSQIALSPVADLMVYSATADGVSLLHVRRLDRLEETPLSGTDGARHPFFSPDGGWIGFFAQGELKKVAVTGGSPISLAKARNDRGGAWSEDGTIVFAPQATTGLFAVPAGGGEVRGLTGLEAGDRSHRWPAFLPGGGRLLFTAQRDASDFDEASIEALDLATGERFVLARGGSNPLFAPPGYLLYARGGTLFAAPFDPETLEVGRAPVPVLQDVQFSRQNGAALLAMGRGLLLYRRGGPTSALVRPVLLTPGEEPRQLFDPRHIVAVSWSPDGSRFALAIDDDGSMDVWIYELRRGLLSRFTFDDAEDYGPVWSPDARWIAFTSARDGPLNLYRKRADGSGEVERLTTNDRVQIADAWSPDGRWLVYRQEVDETGMDILRLDLEHLDAQPEVLVRTPLDEGGADVSPDGRWLAYAAQESKLWQVYVKPFGPGGGKWQVSVDGGVWPRWSPAGDRLYFQQDAVLVAEISAPDGSLQVSAPVEVVPPDRWMGFGFSRLYDVRDGRFVLLQRMDTEARNELVMVTNWLTELERLVPTE